MNSLALGFIKWLLKIAIILAFFAVGCVVVTHCQGRQIKAPLYINHEHASVEDMEEDIRLKSIMVIYTEPRTIFWKKESKEIVYTGSYITDDRSRIGTVQKGCYIALYCYVHNYLYALYPCRE